MRESDLQSFLVMWLSAQGYVVLKRDPKPTTGDAGFPDLEVLGPGGRIVFVETKTPTGQLEPQQVVWHRRLSGLGHRVLLVRHTRDFAAVVAALKEPL